MAVYLALLPDCMRIGPHPRDENASFASTAWQSRLLPIFRDSAVLIRSVVTTDHLRLVAARYSVAAIVLPTDCSATFVCTRNNAHELTEDRVSIVRHRSA